MIGVIHTDEGQAKPHCFVRRGCIKIRQFWRLFQTVLSHACSSALLTLLSRPLPSQLTPRCVIDNHNGEINPVLQFARSDSIDGDNTVTS